ncbi:MAG: ABC-F family ATP-binding cassette domain-containing protein [Solirubrobacterales bacterium]
MSVLRASNLRVGVVGHTLLDGVSLSADRREVWTLAGRNGSGKTTLLRVLAGLHPAEAGGVSVAKGARVALHDQRPPRDQNLSLDDYVLEGAAHLLETEAELRDLEARMGEGDVDERIYDAYAAAQARLEHAGGWAWRERITEIIRGLGLDPADGDRLLSTYSGGELTRASLARALAGDPDVLLLDEPTNHLDVSALEWLEQMLRTTDAAVVLVAHDRWFLEAVGTAVLELEGGRAMSFRGPWHAWRKEKAAREAHTQKAIERHEAQVERLERFVARFRYGTRARQAQSKLKAIDRLERPPDPPRDGRALGFTFRPPERSARVAVELRNATVKAGSRTLLEGAEMYLERGEHVTMVGPNGAGKTSLLSVLSGEAEPASGSARHGHNVKLGVLSQHAQELGEDGTVLSTLRAQTGLKPEHARHLLGQFLFSGEEMEKPVNGLSGGERRRLALAVLVESGANVLILDEPTNHLDIESREALEGALQAYEGSVLLVTHDRALLDAVGTRTLVLRDAVLESHDGGWAEYTARRDAEQASRAQTDGEEAVKRQAKGSSSGSAAKNGGPSKNAVAKQRRVERQIEEAEKALTQLEAELADPAAWSTPKRSEEATRRHGEAKQRVKELYERYEALAG